MTIDKDPLCSCGNLVNHPDVVGDTGHMMDCARYREIVYDEKPDPMKELSRAREEIHYLRGQLMIKKCIKCKK